MAKDFRTNQEKIQGIIYDYTWSKIDSSCVLIEKQDLEKIALRIEKEVFNKTKNKI